LKNFLFIFLLFVCRVGILIKIYTFWIREKKVEKWERKRNIQNNKYCKIQRSKLKRFSQVIKKRRGKMNQTIHDSFILQKQIKN